MKRNSSRRAQFMSVTVLATISIAIVALYLMLAVGYFAAETILSERANSASARREQAAFDKLPRTQQAVSRGVRFLDANITAVLPRDRLFLDYMQRNYNLSESLRAAYTPFDLAESSPSYPSEINYLAPIAFPDKKLAVSPKDVATESSLLVIYSASCKVMPLPDTFWPAMRQAVQTGGSSANSAALAFILFREQGCNISGPGPEIYSRLLAVLTQNITDEHLHKSDMYEAAVYALLLGENQLVGEDWINQLIADQREDGSWTQQDETTDNRHRATLMAVWGLLAYDNLGTPRQPLFAQ